jgi:hypothetical protein
MKTHTFSDNLAQSNKDDQAPWWADIYDTYFMDYAGHKFHPEDSPNQRVGKEAEVWSGDETIWVEQKVRKKDYPDILLEIYLDFENRTTGWARKRLQCDYIAYAVEPAGRCHMLPYLEFRLALEGNLEAWANTYNKYPKGPPEYRGLFPAKNQGLYGPFTTLNLPVPTQVLYDAMGMWSANHLVTFHK